ncbi:hypothetical protein [Streptomyces sp. NPDC003719]
MAGRVLTGNINATGKDFETFGSDEFLHDNQRSIQMPLVIGDNESEIPVAPFKWGGECRIEVHLNAIALDSGTVQVHGFTSFFEGTSEDTPDEKDRELLTFLVPRFKAPHDHATVQAVHMQSGDDLADVTLSLSNLPLDE